MSIFGFYFIGGLLKESGWPRKQGFLRKEVVDTFILDSAIDQMVDWAAALGAGHPMLALQTIAEMFRDRDWSGNDRPNIRTFVEGASAEQESWRATDAVAAHTALQPPRFAAAGSTVRAKTLKEKHLLFEHLYLEGVLWGLANSERFERWYRSQYADQNERLPPMREADLAVDALPDWSTYLSDGEQVLRNYERDIGPLPDIPGVLLADARALGRNV